MQSDVLVKSGRKKEVTANLVTFTEDAHNKKLHFLCSDSEYWEDWKLSFII